MNDFINERNEIFKNLDNPEVMIKVIDYCKKYYILTTLEVVLAGLHKARLYEPSPEITDEMKEKSKLWLKEHNYNLEIY